MSGGGAGGSRVREPGGSARPERGIKLGGRGGEEEENLARGQVAGCEEFLSHGRAASGLAKP